MACYLPGVNSTQSTGHRCGVTSLTPRSAFLRPRPIFSFLSSPPLLHTLLLSSTFSTTFALFSLVLLLSFGANPPPPVPCLGSTTRPLKAHPYSRVIVHHVVESFLSFSPGSRNLTAPFLASRTSLRSVCSSYVYLFLQSTLLRTIVHLLEQCLSIYM